MSDLIARASALEKQVPADVEAITKTASAVRRTIKLIIVISCVAVPIVLTAIYFVDRPLFAEVLRFLWAAREAIFALALSLFAANLISNQTENLSKMIVVIQRDVNAIDARLNTRTTELGKQVDKLEGEAAKATNSVNVAVGKIQDATGGLDATTGKLGEILKQLKNRGIGSGQLPTSPAAVDDVDHWDKVSSHWKAAKDIVEEKINGIENGPRFAKYARMARYDYIPILMKLTEDGLLDSRAIAPFEVMRETFNEFRPRAYEVPGDTWVVFEKNFNEFKRLAAR